MTEQLNGRPAEFWVDSDGVRIHALDWGGAEGGAPVVMLHGAGGTGIGHSRGGWLGAYVAAAWPERQATLLDDFYQAADGSLFGKMPHRVVTELQRVRLEADVVRPRRLAAP